MGDVVKKMGNHMPEGLFGLHIFLPADMTISSLHGCTAIQTILFFSLGNMRQCKILLKNKYKKIQAAFLFRYPSIQVTLNN